MLVEKKTTLNWVLVFRCISFTFFILLIITGQFQSSFHVAEYCMRGDAQQGIISISWTGESVFSVGIGLSLKIPLPITILGWCLEGHPIIKSCYIWIYEITKRTAKARQELFKVKMPYMVGLVLDVDLVRLSSSNCITYKVSL